MDRHFYIVILFATLLTPFCTTLELNKTRRDSLTCQPAPPFAFLLGKEEIGFDVCLFNSTGNLVTNTLSAVGNIVWALQNFGAFFLGSCQCRQDCTPSQIVCEDPVLLTSLLPEGFGLNFLNGLIQIVHKTEMWNLYCYCPAYIEDGADPCIRPPSPELCVP